MATYTTPTTTLIITKPTNFHRLETRYKLVRYELPETLLRVARKNSNAYVLMHNGLRDQLDCPYKICRHDRLDGVEKGVVYALYARYAVPAIVELSLFSGTPLPAREISFDQLDLYALLNLLQVAYCHSERAGRFTGQDVCYVHAKKENNNAHLCLQIDIKYDGCTSSEEDELEVRIVGLARRFQRTLSSRRQPSSFTCFAHEKSSGKCSFFQVKQSEVSAYRQRKEALYEICTYEGKYAALLPLDQRSLEECMGKLLCAFIHDFSLELASYGIVSRSKRRYFSEFIPPDQAQLRFPLIVLSPIAVLDHRLNRESPFQHYLDLLAHYAPAFHFKVITDLPEVRKGVVLVIQDYQQEDFELNGALAGLADAPIDLYKKYPHVVWQSLNVNPNSSIDKTASAYLDYAPPVMDDKDFQTKIDVALAQLYLKDVVQYRRSVCQRLPPLPEEYIFIRKDHPYETLLYIENDILYFLDLRDPLRRSVRDEMLSRLGISWRAMYDMMLQKYRSCCEIDEDQELARYDVIVGPDLFIELKDLNERVLYNYDEIVRRQASMDVALPTEEFKLLPHYDDVCLGYCLPSSTIVMRGLLEKHAQFKSKREVSSLKFYRQLETYDAFLDDVQRCDPLISFNRLTQGAYWEKIIHIFDIQPDKNGHYSRNQLKGYYQKRGWFSNGKEKTLPLYEGVWRSDTNSYLVGPEQPLHQQQLHAHLIRHFDVYQGADHFDILPLLLAASVQYVSQKQHTVYPYAFHLIDLYVESRLRYPPSR